MQISIKKDGNGFLAEILGYPDIYAFAYSEKDVLVELSQVIEMLGESIVFDKYSNPEQSEKNNFICA